MNGNRRQQRSAGGVPPRWLKCPRKSLDYIAERFVAFKTPLSTSYDDHVPIEDRFYPQMIVDYTTRGQKKLGLWIDLTNTDRFYPSDEIKAKGIRYVKVNCRGHGEAPNQDQVKVFNQICETFLEHNPDDVIGVHCTHGFNRSGYLICAFLCSVWDWDIKAAIQQFSRLRPPGIYKQQYLNELCRVYGSPDDGPPMQAPELPEWCFEDKEVEDDDGYATGTRDPSHNNHQSSSSSSTSLLGKQVRGDPGGQPSFKRRKKENFKANPTFMEGVPGVFPVTDRDKLAEVQARVQDMCEWRGSGFPGSQPVSMGIDNIRFLAEKPYMVSWKADGTRYLMLIDGPGEIFFIDRDNCVFHAPEVSFLYRKDLDIHIVNTLVDGEMVLDKDKATGLVTPRYLIYDIIKFRGEDVGKVDFRIRLNCIRDELIGPRTTAMERGFIDRTKEPFGIRFKTFWFLEDTEKLLTGRFTQELGHEPDGVIFQPTKDPYKAGRCDDVLKWKPPHLNTVDFRLKIVQQSGQGLLPIKIGELYVGSLEPPFGKMKVTKNISLLNGKIIECKYDPKQGWTFLRERTDKSFPNAFSTAQAVVKSIAQPVTQEVLLDYIAHNRYIKH